MYGKNFYKQLPVDILADFFIEIRKNIDNSIFSEAMHVELKLIEEAAKGKGISSINDLPKCTSRYNTPA